MTDPDTSPDQPAITGAPDPSDLPAYSRHESPIEGTGRGAGELSAPVPDEGLVTGRIELPGGLPPDDDLDGAEDGHRGEGWRDQRALQLLDAAGLPPEQYDAVLEGLPPGPGRAHVTHARGVSPADDPAAATRPGPGEDLPRLRQRLAGLRARLDEPQHGPARAGADEDADRREQLALWHGDDTTVESSNARVDEPGEGWGR